MGRVEWKASKSLWNSAFMLGAWVLGPLTFTGSAFVVFVALTSFTLCLGHSVGAHRLLIHRSFRAPRWLEYSLVTLGVLVGMAGPLGLVRLHNTRDALQNEPQCDWFFRSHPSPWTDWYHAMHASFVFAVPFEPSVEARVANDAYYQWLERHWRWLQLVCAVPLGLAGGPGWVVWGVVVRVWVSVTGHWFVGWLTHSTDDGRHLPATSRWRNEGSAVQGVNSLLFGALAMGEGWHNNHHAFPRSARLGLLWYELDPGWWAIVVLRTLGLARDIQTANADTRFRRRSLASSRASAKS